MEFLLAILLFVLSACSAYLPSAFLEESPQLVIDGQEEIGPTSSCWIDLSCSFDEIESWRPTTRLDFQQYMQAEHLGLLASADQLGALEGETVFTIRNGLAEPGSWLSYVEAAATEAAERGAALALGYSNDTGSNPGAVRWFNFFEQQRAGRLADRRIHDRLWASASQASTLYGIGQAHVASVPTGTPREQFWVSAIRFRGEVMQERSLIIFFVRAALVFTNKPLAVVIEGVINFFTQVNSPVPARVYSEIVWRLGGILFGFHAVGGLSDPEELMQFPKEFWEAYQEGLKEEVMYRSLKECVEGD